MKPRIADPLWVDTFYAAADPRVAEPAAGCPDRERLQAAAAAEISPAERRAVLDHALGCPYCTESWRLAVRLGIRPKVPLSRHVLAVLWADVGHLLEAPGRLKRSFAGAGGRRLFTVMAAAAAAVALVLAVRGSWIGPAGGGRRPPVAWRGGAELRALPPAEGVLPRHGFVLRWSGPPEALYAIRVTTGADELVDAAADLAEPRYQVPAERLEGVEPGTLVFYRISVRLADGTTAAETFSVRVE